MKKVSVVMLAALMAATLGLVSCGGLSAGKSEGWLDNDTFRVMGLGVVPKNVENVMQKKIMSKEAALIDAKEKMVSKIVGSYIESTGATENGELIGKVVKEKAAGSLRGVSIIDTKWDAEYNCEIVAELKSENLKKFMDDLIKAYLQEVKGQKTAAPVMGK
ncbi:MAG: hypothetical protein HZC28_01785 [Spirochaetes bacterium]|nr:hypothetical protein [Spirochaetota bacterium]